MPGRTALAGLALSCLAVAGCGGVANQSGDRNAPKYATGGTFTMVLHDDRAGISTRTTRIS
jgi:hypothetical protein